MNHTEVAQLVNTYGTLNPNFRRWVNRLNKESKADTQKTMEAWQCTLDPFTWDECLALLDAFKAGAVRPLEAVEFGEFAFRIRELLYTRRRAEHKDAELAKELERTRIIKTMRAQRRPVDEINAVLASHGMDDWAGYDAMKGLKLALKTGDDLE